MENKLYRDRFIYKEQSLLEALKKMDSIDKKLLIVIDAKTKYVSLLSAGDIQRSIIQNIPLDTSIDMILKRNVKIASSSDSYEEIKKMMLKFRMELCPVVSENREIKNIYFWEDLFDNKKPQPLTTFRLPVVIMAGGFGTRLKPLTNVLPKPLIPINQKTIIEHIFERFSEHGCDEFYISVNYKAELIEYYLNEQALPYKLHFFKEKKPMGTAGSLSLLKGKIDRTFFVSNCDILIEQDYSEILAYHRETKNEITIIAALKTYNIPYGTIQSGSNGELIELTEKPEITFKINSGMYILEPHLIDELPEDEFFHITHMIEKVKNRKGQIGVFPVSEKSWKDIGEWDEYLKLLNLK